MDDTGRKKNPRMHDGKGTAGEKRLTVVPGEKLGVIEEYVPGQGTYVKDGNILSSTIGKKEIGQKTRDIHVSSVRQMTLPIAESIVEGQVSTTQEKMANIRILKVDDKDSSGSFTGVIHISTASDEYVKAMPYVCKPGDIVRAKVISYKNGVYHLSTADRNLGVMYAFCSKCGNLLLRTGRNLQCSNCNNIEERKISGDYGTRL